MGRKRIDGDLLPQGVHRVHAPSGATYFFWQPGRGTARAQPRVPLGKDPRDPEFWRKLDQLKGLPAADPLFPGSWAALDRGWRGDPTKGVEPSREWAALQPGTRAIYGLRMRRVVETWAGLQVALTDVAGIAALRDAIDGPVAANQMVKVIRAAMKWGRAHGYPSADPAAGLPPRDEGEVEGATPWPEWAYQIIVSEAPEPLRRAAFLGRAIGQRRSDLVRIGKCNRRDDGLAFRIQKLRDKPHFMPLFEHELAEIDGWPALDIGPYITLNGKAMTGDGLAAKLKAFCQAHPRLKDSEVFLHGLRALAVCDRRIDGASHQEIGNQLCMSLGMVMRYSKGIDTEAASRAANVRRAANRAPKSGAKRD
jgi:hypothetical protein